MFDKFRARQEMPRDVLHTTSYKPEHAVLRRTLLNPTANMLSVLFPPWHGGGVFYDVLARRLAKSGSAVLKYYFHDEILKASRTQVPDSFRHMKEVITGDLGELGGKGRDVRAYAMSLGNPVLTQVTREFQGFSSVTMVTPATSLAACMWEGARTLHIKDELEAQGCTLPGLEVDWSELAMVNHVEHLQGTEVNVVTSSTDTIIPARHQQDYIAALHQAGVHPSVQTTNVGHYATIVNFCLHGALE